MFKTVFFDLDGTLVDSMYEWKKIVRDYSIERKIILTEKQIVDIKGLNLEGYCDYVAKNAPIGMTSEEMNAEIEEIIIKYYKEYFELKPHVTKILDAYYKKGIPMYLTTATKKEVCYPLLERKDISKYFKEIITPYMVNYQKDTVDFFEKALEYANNEPEKTILFDDSIFALNAAKTAGIKTCGVYDAASSHETENIKIIADYYIDSFENWEI